MWMSVYFKITTWLQFALGKTTTKSVKYNCNMFKKAYKETGPGGWWYNSVDGNERVLALSCHMCKTSMAYEVILKNIQRQLTSLNVQSYCTCIIIK